MTETRGREGEKERPKEGRRKERRPKGRREEKKRP